MRITERIHAIKIPFKVPLAAEVSIDRFAFVYLVLGDSIHLIDSGVAGADTLIWDYLKGVGRGPDEVSSLILTHSHPDHIGAASSIKARTGCTVYGHALEQRWIEDTARQYSERPIPGFHTLVAGPVAVDKLVAGGGTVYLENGIRCHVIHTPGHSQGSISLWFAEEKALFSGDALLVPGDLPIYEDISTCLSSIATLQTIDGVETLFSSWESPLQGRQKIRRRMEESDAYLRRIHQAVINNDTGQKEQDVMVLCRKVVEELKLPPVAVMPLVAKAFASSLAVAREGTGTGGSA